MAICTWRSFQEAPAAEVLAVAIRCRAEAAMECSVQRLGAASSPRHGDGHDGEFGISSSRHAGLNTEPLDERRRRFVPVSRRKARANLRGLMPVRAAERVDGEVLVEMVAEPRLQVGDRGRRSALEQTKGAINAR